jgi:DNA-binding transcriptional regulator PaaX
MNEKGDSQTKTKREQYGKFAKEIIKAIAIGVVILFVLSSPNGTRRLLKGAKDEWDQKNTRETLERLQKRRLISLKEKSDGSLQVVLTQSGRRKVEEWRLEDLQLNMPKRWDGRWWIVAFDIAEKRKKAREALRHMLHQMSFYQLQKSVFIHPFPCEAEITLLKKVFHIPNREVLCFSVDDIPGKQRLKKKFHLDG